MKTKTRYVLLGLLAQNPQTGYDLKKHIDEHFKSFWNESYGQIYPELKSLVMDGLIEIEQKKSTSRKNTKYRISPSGQAVLEAWLKIEPEKESVRLEILLKTYFSKFGAKHSLIDYLEEFKVNHDLDLKRLKAVKDAYLTNSSKDLELMRILDFGIKVNKAYIQWCDESLQEFKKELSV